MYYSSGNYEAFAIPKKPEGVDAKSAYLIGSGLAALSAACFLVRDGQMKGEHVHILEKDPIPGGACDGYKYQDIGYVMRGGREMDNHFECMWDLFRSIPSIEDENYTVLDEYYWLNKADPNYSLCRATVNRGQDAHTDGKFGLSDKGAMEILQLFMTPDEKLYDKKITDFFDDEVLNTNFWMYWRTMFAFENWHSALEMKRYLQRYIHHIGGLPDFTALRFTRYNQYESMILPMVKYLESFGVQAKLLHVTHGPAITRYELAPAPGVKVSRIVGLVDDIALNMASDGVRIEAPIPGKPAVGIEIPNQKIEMVSLRDVLESPEMMREKSPTAVALGKGISGAPVIADMAKMPHVLIAGATGSGKSVCINTIINSIIFRAKPEEVRLILIDPKVVELSVYNGIPHLLVPVVTDPKKASAALSWAVVEMEHRYKRFETMGVRDIRGYNNAIGPNEEPMSKIIVIIDELADLMMVVGKDVEDSICRIAQKARAAGMHLIVATQRPSVDVITGLIKANIPSRIAFAVSSQVDSRTILDGAGAEKLLGMGDMLFMPVGAPKPTRIQGTFVRDEEISRVLDFIKKSATVQYDEAMIEAMEKHAIQDGKKGSSSADSDEEGGSDPMLKQAVEVVIDAGQASTSLLQRRCKLGYARAARIMDEMEEKGIIGPYEGAKPRAVLISRQQWLEMQMNQPDE